MLLKGMCGLAHVWVAAFNGDPTSLARDNIYGSLVSGKMGVPWLFIELMQGEFQ